MNYYMSWDIRRLGGQSNIGWYHLVLGIQRQLEIVRNDGGAGAGYIDHPHHMLLPGPTIILIRSNGADGAFQRYTPG